MKTISQHLGQIILAVAAVALIIGVVLTFGSPVHNFMDGVMDKLYEVGNGPIWNVGGTTTAPDEGGSGAGGTGDEDSVLGLRRFKEYDTLEEFQNCLDTCPSNLTLADEDELLSDGVDYFIIYPTYASANDTAYAIVKQSFVTQEFTYLGRYDISGTDGEITVDWSNNATFEITKASSNEDYNAWLLANTEPVEEEESYVIEAGTYRFNDVLTELGLADINDYMIEYTVDGVSYNVFGNTVVDGGSYLSYAFVDLETYSITRQVDFYSYIDNSWYEGASKTFTVLNDVELNDYTYEWFTANTKRVIEVDELPTEDIDTGAIYKVNETVVDDSIVGTWVFNDKLYPMPELDYAYVVKFTWTGSSGSVWEASSIKYVLNSSTNMYWWKFYDVADAAWYDFYNINATWVNTDSITGDWVNSSLKTITITEEPTDETFITWLKANATKQGGETVEKYYQYVDGAWVEQ